MSPAARARRRRASSTGGPPRGSPTKPLPAAERFLLCGNSGMVVDARDILIGRGVTFADVDRRDLFLTAPMKENLLGSTLPGSERSRRTPACPAYAGRQLADWIYRKGATRFDEMSNLPRAARAASSPSATASSSSPPVKVTESSDGTKKYLFAGQRRVRGGGVDPRGAARHSLPLGPGRLQDGLPVLHDGEAGFPGPPHRRRDPQPVPEPARSGSR